MHRYRLAAALIATGMTLTALVGCAPGDADATGVNDATGVIEATDAASVASETITGDLLTRSSEPGEARSSQQVITTAQLDLEARAPDTTADKIVQIVQDLGGSIDSASVHRAAADAGARAELTVRVPATKLEAVITEISRTGSVISQSSSAQNVTASYADLEARVSALETSITRLNELIEGAETTSDLLEAESALTQRQQDLDGLRAQLRVLADEVDQSTIWVTITAPSVLPGGGPGSFWEGLHTGVASLGAAFAGALVILGVLLPWGVLAAAVTALVVVTVRLRRSRRQRAAQPEAQSTTPR